MVSSDPNNNKPWLIDKMRGVAIRATPEEKIRQKLLKVLIEELFFPKECIVIEKALSELPHLQGKHVPKRRLDILCYFPMHDQLLPLLLIECKKSGGTKQALSQVNGYNYWVKAPFVAVANQEGILLKYLDIASNEIVLKEGLPSYQDLIACCK
ncbi:type I restriction enzyme HsdR N-terminal domain-containing protein [Candidatus Rhabdochlamydia porcellionis]|uniref:Type I restriction enzyme R protein N terminus (HSDR_N) n=1 Tax=Candidatus Rhabdochlamydia porcellionis TaxID=225148 RepID=A0ABX8Z0F2_9BACT|nr:type I restriction enzyme HsdR N-terminal domain-containing protein [Candidatus Rhabdochlamydia porcellionis]QZA59149.1 Type I restriction enzyme R protein N terminus (HSDR_N) [Candidatus Rhabdochlamydia porcellionis]